MKVLNTQREEGDGGPLSRSEQLHAIIESALTALDDGFLSGIVLGVYSIPTSTVPRCLLESYIFNVRYPDGHISAGTVEIKRVAAAGSDGESYTIPNVRGQMIQLIRGLQRVTSSLNPIQQDCTVSMRLFFTADTPAEYQPRGKDDGEGGWGESSFVDATGEPLVFFRDKFSATSMGKIETHTHTLSMKVAYDEKGREEEGEVAVEVEMVEKEEDRSYGRKENTNNDIAVSRESVLLPSLKTSDTPTPLSLPQGIDSAAYQAAQRIILSGDFPFISVKGLQSALLALFLTQGISLDVSPMQARKIMAHLALEGILKGGGGGRVQKYEVLEGARTAHRLTQVKASIAAATPSSMKVLSGGRGGGGGTTLAPPRDSTARGTRGRQSTPGKDSTTPSPSPAHHLSNTPATRVNILSRGGGSDSNEGPVKRGGSGAAEKGGKTVTFAAEAEEEAGEHRGRKKGRKEPRRGEAYPPPAPTNESPFLCDARDNVEDAGYSVWGVRRGAASVWDTRKPSAPENAGSDRATALIATW